MFINHQSGNQNENYIFFGLMFRVMTEITDTDIPQMRKEIHSFHSMYNVCRRRGWGNKTSIRKPFHKNVSSSLIFS